MKILTVMYKSSLELHHLRELFRKRARRYARVDGLREKIYVHDPATGEVGGIYLFASDATLAKFRESGFEKNIQDTYRVKSPLVIRAFDVVMTLRDESVGISSSATARTNKDVLRSFIESGLSQGDPDALDAFFVPDYVEHENDITPPSVEGLKIFIRRAHEAFPDLSLTIEDIVATEDRAWARSRVEGTHEMSFLGIAPTHKRVRIVRFDECRIDRGKIAEHWGVIDRFSLVRQLRNPRRLE